MVRNDNRRTRPEPGAVEMIIDPDFLDHWKTRVLVAELGGDEVAPCYVIRWWAHCQLRRQWVFDGLSAAAIKAICRYPGDADEFMSAMKTAGFLSVAGGRIEAVGWDEYNAALIAAWTNGKKGGRPRKKNPRVTDGIPMGNPPKTDGVTDKIGLDGIGSDGMKLDGSGAAANGSTRFAVQPIADRIFLQLPKNRQRKKSKFRDACADAWEGGLDIGLMEPKIMESLNAYYASDEGRSQFAREPATLIRDEVWDENPEAWKAAEADAGEPKKEFDYDRWIAGED